ncbi:hypothetical protein GTY23_04200 [Streptomyces sp. SID5998]|nr:hypothetical protein [Streptomyces sp. SID5998]
MSGRGPHVTLGRGDERHTHRSDVRTDAGHDRPTDRLGRPGQAYAYDAPGVRGDRPAPGHRSRPGREETCTGREETCTGREETFTGREETFTGLEETVTADRPEYGTKAGDAMAYSAWLR